MTSGISPPAVIPANSGKIGPSSSGTEEQLVDLGTELQVPDLVD